MPPVNDAINAAITLVGATSTVAYNLTDATYDPTPGAVNGYTEQDYSWTATSGSIWYTFTAAVLSTADFSLVGTDGDYHSVQVWTWDGVSYPPDFAYGNDDGVLFIAEAYSSSTANVNVHANFFAQAGVTYYIQVESNTISGTGTLAWTSAPYNPLPPPDNDNFVNATVITGASGTQTFDTGGSTYQVGEQRTIGQAGRPLNYDGSIWYSWTAPSDLEVTWTPSLTNTSVQIWANTPNLTALPTTWDLWVAGNGVYLSPPINSVTLYAHSGTTYFLQLESYVNDVNGTFSWTSTAYGFPVPNNDMFANAQVLPSETTGSVSYDMRNATDERITATIGGNFYDLLLDPPLLGFTNSSYTGEANNGSIWFAWTAPSDCWVRFDPSGEVKLQVYIPTVTPRFFEPIAMQADPNRYPFLSYLEFSAQAGMTYYLMMCPLRADQLHWYVGTSSYVGTLSWATVNRAGQWSPWIEQVPQLVSVPSNWGGVQDLGYLDGRVWYSRTTHITPFQAIVWVFSLGLFVNQSASDESWVKSMSNPNPELQANLGNYSTADASTSWYATAIYNGGAAPGAGGYFMAGVSQTTVRWSLEGVLQARPVPALMATMQAGVDYALLPEIYDNSIPIVEYDHSQQATVTSGGDVTGNWIGRFGLGPFQFYTNALYPPAPNSYSGGFYVHAGTSEPHGGGDSISQRWPAQWYTSDLGTELIHLKHEGQFIADGVRLGDNLIKDSSSLVDVTKTAAISDLEPYVENNQLVFHLANQYFAGPPPADGEGSTIATTYGWFGGFEVDNLQVWLNIKYPRYRYWMPQALTADPGPAKVQFYNPWG